MVRPEGVGLHLPGGIGHLAARVRPVVGPHTLEFRQHHIRHRVQLLVDAAIHIRGAPEFVFDPSRIAIHARIIRSLQERALPRPRRTVGVGRLRAVAIRHAGEHEPRGRQHGVGLRRVIVIHRARDHLGRAGAVACLHFRDHRLRDRSGVAALEAPLHQPGLLACTAKVAHLADLFCIPSAEIDPREAEVHVGIVKKGRRVSVRRLVKGPRGIVLIGRAAAKWHARELQRRRPHIVELHFRNVAESLRLIRIGGIEAEIAEGRRIRHRQFAPQPRARRGGDRGEGDECRLVHRDGLVADAQPAPGRLCHQRELAVCIVGELIGQPVAVLEVLKLVISLPARRELLEVIDNAIRAPQVIVRRGLREDVPDGWQRRPHARAQGEIRGASCRVHQPQLAPAGAHQLPLVGMPPLVPVAKPAIPRDEPRMPRAAPAEPRAAHAAENRKVVHPALHIARREIHRVGAAVAAVAVLIGVAGLAVTPGACRRINGTVGAPAGTWITGGV